MVLIVMMVAKWLVESHVRYKNASIYVVIIKMMDAYLLI